MVEGIGSQYSDVILSRTCNLSGKKRKWKEPAFTNRLPLLCALPNYLMYWLATETLRDRYCNSHFAAVDASLPNAATLPHGVVTSN